MGERLAHSESLDAVPARRNSASVATTTLGPLSLSYFSLLATSEFGTRITNGLVALSAEIRSSRSAVLVLSPVSIS